MVGKIKKDPPGFAEMVDHISKHPCSLGQVIGFPRYFLQPDQGGDQRCIVVKEGGEARLLLPGMMIEMNAFALEMPAEELHIADGPLPVDLIPKGFISL